MTVSREGLLFVSWNVHGLTAVHRDAGEKSDTASEVRLFLRDCHARGERVAGLALQETWLLEDDDLEVVSEVVA